MANPKRKDDENVFGSILKGAIALKAVSDINDIKNALERSERSGKLALGRCKEADEKQARREKEQQDKEDWMRWQAEQPPLSEEDQFLNRLSEDNDRMKAQSTERETLQPTKVVKKQNKTQEREGQILFIKLCFVITIAAVLCIWWLS
jgi:hypothetical protein